MSKAKTKNSIKRLVDAAMTVLLLLLMAYQVTGEALHEWIGIGMTALVILHQILNRKWYASLFKGKYNGYRILSTAINTLLLLVIGLTAFCGMSMSGHHAPRLPAHLLQQHGQVRHESQNAAVPDGAQRHFRHDEHLHPHPIRRRGRGTSAAGGFQKGSVGSRAAKHPAAD